ncbi:hypothetical protein [Streptomyces sp. ID05-47C]|uniref:hypothetical protein n=1 Tax=Streptomyces sp. ID05-47C TaxID=3028665 RepID=UPI0029BA2157|nr:hypothetical protein [Streptomyces sp. ID05-47C]MDX3570639.1 hypothetical protein [Streptomyces sp. ID05-47C]
MTAAGRRVHARRDRRDRQDRQDRRDWWPIEFEEGAVIDCCAQTFERHLYGYDLVPENLGGEKLEKHLWMNKPVGEATGIAGPSNSTSAQESGLNPPMP